MFEDVYAARPDVKNEIKEILMESIEDALKYSTTTVEDEKLIQHFRNALEEQMDMVVETYIDYFSIDELVNILDWAKSSIGRKYAKFHLEMLTPITTKITQNVMFKMIADEEGEDFANEVRADFDNRLESKIGQSCTFEEDCLCGCEGGDPDEDSDILFFGAELEEDNCDTKYTGTNPKNPFLD
jgi:hypothetical protein